MVINANGKEYRIKFNYNAICDTDLLEKVDEVTDLFKNEESKGSEKVVKLFNCVRDLLYVGLIAGGAKISTKKEVGDIMDAYREETPEGESREIFDLFLMLTDELSNEGFLGGLWRTKAEETEGKTEEQSPEKTEATKN